MQIYLISTFTAAGPDPCRAETPMLQQHEFVSDATRIRVRDDTDLCHERHGSVSGTTRIYVINYTDPCQATNNLQKQQQIMKTVDYSRHHQMEQQQCSRRRYIGKREQEGR